MALSRRSVSALRFLAISVNRSSSADVFRFYYVNLLDSFWPDSLETTRQIEDKLRRASLLSRLAEHLPELWPEALELTRQIKDESSRAEALSGLAQHLPEALWPEALEKRTQNHHK